MGKGDASVSMGTLFFCTESSSSLARESLFICWASSAAFAFGSTFFMPSSEPSLMASWGLEIEQWKFDDSHSSRSSSLRFWPRTGSWSSV